MDDLPAGMYSAGGRIPRVPKNVEFVVGWFEETLPKFLEKEPIAFMNIDCDIYSATATIFENLGHLIVPGTVIVSMNTRAFHPGGKTNSKPFRNGSAEPG